MTARSRSIGHAAVCVAALALALPTAAPAAPRPRFGISAGVLVPTVLSVDGETPVTEPGFLVVITFDAARREWLDAGLFLHTGSFTAERRDEQVNLFELGLAAHWVRPLDGKTTLRVGGGFGYRRLFADTPRYDATDGLAVNADATLSLRLATRLLGEVRLGALSQPWGRSQAGTVWFAPMPYLTLGAVF